MLVAFPVDENDGLGSRISDHFGRATGFLLFDTESENVKYVDAPTHAFGSFPQFLGDLGVNALVCNNIGDKARELIGNLGITVFSQFSGKVSDALEHLMPKFEEIDKQIREEEERKKAQALALQRSIERHLTYTIIALDGSFLVIVKLDEENFVLVDLDGEGCNMSYASFSGEVDSDDSKDKYLALRFRYTRFLGKQEVSVESNEGVVKVGTYLFEIREEEKCEVPDKVMNALSGLDKDVESTGVKDRLKAINDWLYELVHSREHE